MKRYIKFYISFTIFIIAILAIDQTDLAIRQFEVINLKVSILFLFAIYLWLSQAVPNSFTSILVILLIAVFKLDSFHNVISYTFGNIIFVFLIAIFMISYAFRSSGLAKRAAEAMLKSSGGNKRKILFSIMASSYILSMFLSVIAGVSITLPVALKILDKNNITKGDNFGKAIILGVAYGGLIGGIATPLGTPVNILMLQYLNEFGNYPLTFLTWIMIGIPLSSILLFFCYLIIHLMTKVKNEYISIKSQNHIPFSNREKSTIVAFLIIFSMFIFSQLFEKISFLSFNIVIISLISSFILTLPPFSVVKWEQALKNIDWEAILFLAGSIGLGYLLYNTGTAALIASLIFNTFGDLDPYAYVFVFSTFAVLMHLVLSSNTVTGTVIIPILISLSAELGTSAWYVAGPAMFCVSLAFILPTESPTNVITYNTGYYKLKDMILTGTTVTIMCVIVISLFFILLGIYTPLYIIG